MDLAQRVKFHGALGDAGRLTIVEALGLSDLSPSDLARQLGIGSNLVAHHLSVLQEAGIIQRMKSQGDGRRSYVRLRWDHPLLAGLGHVQELAGELGHPRRVVFLCTENSARSQLAASVWRHVSPLPAASAGTHPARHVHPGAIRTAARHGLPLDNLQPRHVDDVVTDDDLIVAVCDQVHERLPCTPRLHWSIPDPVATVSPHDFEGTFDDILRRARRLATILAQGT
ncbi:ArsR family transcriptional regulator [Microlunatus sp. Y2014]|uniref:arsenate reductase/protein-tyrosine-phosphatase family protein n=1 Tax=Microlunatus sp. Y2014 TaxID=3418488 RepID=UPI003DA6D3BD